MAEFGENEVCEVSGDVSFDGKAFEAGTIKLIQDTLGVLSQLGPYVYFLKVITTRESTEFIFKDYSFITATNNSIIFSKVPRWRLYANDETVHLKDAEQSQIQQFLDALPASIREKYLREPTRTNRESRQEQKATLHKKTKRVAQQSTSRQEQLQQQKELGEALERRLRRMEQEMRGKDEQQENLQRQLREKDEQQENLQRQLREMEQQLIHCQGQLRGKEEEVNELELSFSLAQQTINEQRNGFNL